MAKYKHITEPDQNGFQVRIVRNGTEHSRYFSHRSWGGKDKSLNSAQNWRDQMLVVLAVRHKNLLNREPLPTKRSTGVRGVSKSIQYDKRRNVHYLVYEVHWKSNNEFKNKSFHVGRLGDVDADEELHAFRTALQFRKEYEWCRENGEFFDAERYRPWKKKRLYDER